ncbi:MAG: SGNH/GDSL hydrolase family protein, partial [Oscillibacter sp.]|nr:SGNH/GDSL hydrolase family protein [Oscillibacter sp.]
PGGCLTPDGLGRGNVLRAVFEDDGKENADLITLEVLPNEGANVGGIYDTDETTFCGCLNRALRHLQERTQAQIVLIVMILGNDAPPETVSPTRGCTNFEFAEKAERVGRLNGVPVINAFTDAGFGYGRVRAGAYQKDRIHLNDLGGRIMGEFVWSRLKEIPLWEKT